jgi:hypothetical protein
MVREHNDVIGPTLEPVVMACIFEAELEIITALPQAHRPPMSEALDGDPLPFGLSQPTNEVADQMERNTLGGNGTHAEGLLDL